MPFEFTGEAPVWQASITQAAKSIFQPLGNGSALTKSAAAAPGFGFASSFGSPAPSGSAQLPWPMPSILRPVKGSLSPTHTLLGPAVGARLSMGVRSNASAAAVDAEKEALKASAADDFLSQALRRAIHRRRAVFGGREVAVDNVLSAFSHFDNGGGTADELRGLGEDSATRKLINYLLSELVGVKTQPRLREELSQPKKTVLESPSSPVGTAQPPVDLGAAPDLAEETFKIAKGSAAYQAIVVTAMTNTVLCDLVPKPEARMILCEHMVGLVGRGKKMEELLEVEIVLGKDRNDYQCMEVVADVFWCTKREVVQHERSTTAPLAKKSATHHGTPATQSAKAQQQATAEIQKPSTNNRGTPTPFRFLDLPAELRMWIYRDLLSPGHISIRAEATEVRRTRVFPRDITPQILRLCKQTHKEAKDILYEENTVCLTMDVDFGVRPMIGRHQMSASGLPRLRSVMLMLDACHSRDFLLQEPWHCDWQQLQAMTGLKDARICLVEREDHAQSMYGECKINLLREIIERLPLGCKVHFESREGDEDEHVQDAFDAIARSGRGELYKYSAYEVEEDVPRRCMVTPEENLWEVQGSKSGHTRDYRWPEKKGLQLEGLVKAEEDIDESIVLGSSR